MKKKSNTSDRDKGDTKVSNEKNEGRLSSAAHALNIEKNELEKLPEEIKKKLLIQIAKASYYEGPIPPPAVVKEYEKVLKGSFNRILKMTEENSKHRMELDQHEMELEKFYLPQTVKIRQKGQIFAFSISVLGIVGAVVCAFLGQVTIGSIVGGSTLISLVPHFISGIRNDKTGKSDD
jgi:uncharacterized membrane protein